MIQLKFGSQSFKPFPVKSLTFSGGEIHVNLEQNSFGVGGDIYIYARITSASDAMELFMVTDALKRMYPESALILIMPYIPYARQDRVCQKGDAFSLKVFAGFINTQGYKSVIVADAHSYVATALIDRVMELPQSSFANHLAFMETFPEQERDFMKRLDFIIAPDAGASKKAEEFTKVLSHIRVTDIDVVQSLKVRDKVGAITSTNVLCDDFAGRNCLIVDDICDGGRTFTELAKVLKEKGAGQIGLYVTHGIFSRGLDVIFENGIDFVFTTDSFEQPDTRAKMVYRFFK
jgi:ribose-phosphate pyrophosphokinase